MTIQAHAIAPASFDSAPAAVHGKARIWTGRVISGLVIAFLTFDSVCKLIQLPVVLEASAKLGFSSAAIFAIGLTLFVCTALYTIPRTATLGAVLLTGYFGGAVCTHVRNFEGAFPIAFSLTFGVLVWVGLGLRDERVKALIAPRPR